MAAEHLMHFVDEQGIEYDTLIGDVRITQDSLFLFCSRAYVRDQSYIEAIDNVVIVQEDSIHLFADSLIYDDNKEFANLYGEVVIQNGEKKLFTSEAEYNVRSKKARYDKGATLYNANTELISEEGIYDIDRDFAKFKGRVTIRDSSSVLRTDSLDYDLAKDEVYIIAPTNMDTDSTSIYCERGYYSYKAEQGRFYKNLQILTGSKTILADWVDYYAKEKRYVLTGHPLVRDDKSEARADTIVYFDNEDRVELIGRAYYRDEKQELRSDRIDYNLSDDVFETKGASEVLDEQGRILKADRIYRDDLGNDIAESRISLRDTSEDVTLFGDWLIMDGSSSEVKTYNYKDQPLLVKELEKDSLFVKSDTLFFIEKKTEKDTQRIYRGTNNVRFIKDKVSGRSDNIIFNSTDSIFLFLGKPIMWSDSTQIWGDTIKIKLSGNEIEYMEVIGNAFMVMLSDSSTYDQVKGEKITNYFDGNDLSVSEVKGNVEMVYFMFQDGKLGGINHSLCGGLVFYFADAELRNISFLDKPNSTFKRGNMEDLESHNLQGFSWDIESKPRKETFVR